MGYQPKHVFAKVRALSWRARIGIVAAVALATAGGGVAFAATSVTSGVPTQQVRTGPNIADFCFTYGTNMVHNYDWNQTPCPAGTYPLSFVSAPQDFTLKLGDQAAQQCKLTAHAVSGNESDAITCTAPAPTVTTGAAVDISGGSAVLTGTESNVSDTSTCSFKYDTDASYLLNNNKLGQSVPATVNSDGSVVAQVKPLTVGDQYDFQLVCGSVSGAIQSFTAK